MKQNVFVSELSKSLGEIELLQIMAQKITKESDGQFNEKDEEHQEILKEIEAIAQSIQKNTVLYLKEKPKQLEHLEDWEEKLIQKCEDEPKIDTIQLRGTFAALLFGVGKLINLSAFLYENYKVTDEQKKALNVIDQKGLAAMPGYQTSIVEDLVQLVVFYAFEDAYILKKAAENLKKAKDLAEKLRAPTPCFRLEEGAVLLKIAEYAYSGIRERRESDAVKPMEDQSLPEALRLFYNKEIGLLDIPGGIKGFIGLWNGNIVIGFAGTDIKNKIPTLGADIQQIVSPGLMYLRAVGIVRMMAEKNEYTKIIVVGHSLGGGLAQAAVVANSNKEQIYGAAFNSAGLSLATLAITEKTVENDIEKVAKKITHFRAKLDPVSAFGALVGSVTVLEGASFPYHCIHNIENCFR